MGEDGDGCIRANYGANYDRLASIKKTYDPGNLLRINQNIAPALGWPAAQHVLRHP